MSIINRKDVPAGCLRIKNYSVAMCEWLTKLLYEMSETADKDDVIII